MSERKPRLCLRIFPLEWDWSAARTVEGTLALSFGPFQILRYMIRKGSVFRPSRLSVHIHERNWYFG